MESGVLEGGRPHVLQLRIRGGHARVLAIVRRYGGLRVDALLVLVQMDPSLVLLHYCSEQLLVTPGPAVDEEARIGREHVERFQSFVDPFALQGNERDRGSESRPSVWGKSSAWSWQRSLSTSTHLRQDAGPGHDRRRVEIDGIQRPGRLSPEEGDEV